MSFVGPDGRMPPCRGGGAGSTPARSSSSSTRVAKLVRRRSAKPVIVSSSLTACFSNAEMEQDRLVWLITRTSPGETPGSATKVFRFWIADFGFWIAGMWIGEMDCELGIRNPQFLVSVAQLAERRIVAPEATGSNPVTHPKRPLRGGVIGNTPDSDSGD